MKKEYSILFATSSAVLEVKANQALNLGWQPQGGLVVKSGSKGQDFYYQALVKETKDSQEPKKNG